MASGKFCPKTRGWPTRVGWLTRASTEHLTSHVHDRYLNAVASVVAVVGLAVSAGEALARVATLLVAPVRTVPPAVALLVNIHALVGRRALELLDQVQLAVGFVRAVRAVRLAVALLVEVETVAVLTLEEERVPACRRVV